MQSLQYKSTQCHINPPPPPPWLQGAEAESAMQQLCANNMAVQPGQVVYTGMLNSRGGFQTDCTVTRLSLDKWVNVYPLKTTQHHASHSLVQFRYKSLEAWAFLPDIGTYHLLSKKDFDWYLKLHGSKPLAIHIRHAVSRISLVQEYYWHVLCVYICIGMWPSVLQLSPSMLVRGWSVTFPHQSAFKMWPPNTVYWQWWAHTPGTCFSHSPELHSTTKAFPLPLLRWINNMIIGRLNVQTSLYT